MVELMIRGGGDPNEPGGSGNDGPDPESTPLANGDQAQIDTAKFDKYSMDPNNPNNGGKWKAFEDLGYDVNDANGRTQGVQDVIQQLREELPNQSAIAGKTTAYGSRFEVDVPIRGPNGQEGTLVTIWQYDTASDIPRLITNWLKVSK